MRVRLWLVLSLLVSGTTWFYMHRILDPWAQYVDREKAGLTQMGDIYPRWVGTRELLLHRLNPYGPQVSEEIQIAFYGHAVAPDNLGPGHKIIDEQRFAYPLYVVILLTPTMYADFSEVQRWAPLVLALFTVVNVLLCLRFLRRRLPWETVTALVLFTLSSPQIVQGLRHQQLALVVGLLLTAGAWCVSKNHLVAAGALLAYSTIKPQMALLPLCWFLVWAVGDWRNRWRLLAGFFVTLAALITAGEIILPGWLGYFFAGAAAYRKYFPTTSLLRVALGDTPGEILGGILVVALLILAWRNRKAAGDSERFEFTLAAFFIGTILAFPLFTPFNQVLLILPTMLVVRDWKAVPRLSRVLFAVVMSWPWVISLILLLFPPQLRSPSRLPVLPSVLVSFVPLILTLALMTRRSDTVEGHLPADSPQRVP
jgi:glycosyl transferase family 87